MSTTWEKPDPTILTSYQKSYVDQVPDGPLPTILEQNGRDTVAFLRSLPAEKIKYRYAPGKWSIAELVQHLTDCERIFAYRMLCIARGEQTPLPGFEENDYARESGADQRSFSDILDEFSTVRTATVSLLKSFSDTQLDRKGTSNGKPAFVRSLAFMVAGHELHHIKVIKERYLK